MPKIILIPHKFRDYTRYVNGLEDVLAWKGNSFIDFLLPVVGGIASFAYLKFKRANPPCIVYGAPTRSTCCATLRR